MAASEAETKRVAVVDIGTISCRLLITGGGGPVVREMRITRTGEGLRDTGSISAAAIERVTAALSAFAQIIDSDGSVETRTAVATSAARDAANRDELFAAASAGLGVEPRLLSGEEEARLSFAGAVAGLDHLGAVLVIDIGGGSTEFAIGSTADGIERAMSVDTGAARVTSEFLESDPPHAAELSAALSVIELHLDDVTREMPEIADALSSSGLILGVGGTITTMAAVEIGLIEYDRDHVHGFDLERAAAEDVFRTLATEAAEDRRHNPGLHPDRVDLIVGGACVLVEIMRHYDIENIRVSENDLLDALAAELQ